MMSTFAAPVLLLISSTFLATSLAVLTFDWDVLYLQLFSSALVQPSLSKFLHIVVQSDSLSAHPWTKRIGSWALDHTAAGATTWAVASATASSIFRIGFPHLFVCP